MMAALSCTSMAFRLMVIADEDGIVATLFKGEEVQTEMGFDLG